MNMTQKNIGNYQAIVNHVNQEVNPSSIKSFIDFLHFCVAHLDTDDSVQAIWNDFQRKAE